MGGRCCVAIEGIPERPRCGLGGCLVVREDEVVAYPSAGWSSFRGVRGCVLFRLVTFANNLCRFFRGFFKVPQACREDTVANFEAGCNSVFYRLFRDAIVVLRGRGFTRFLPTICYQFNYRTAVIDRRLFYLCEVFFVWTRNEEFGTDLYVHVDVFRVVLGNARVVGRRTVA